MNDAATISHALLEAAIAENASDIHFHPHPKTAEADVYFRINGRRNLHTTLTKDEYRMLLAFYKFTSEMDIGEIRKPQNGTLETLDPITKRRFSLRLSTLPVSQNESLAIRLLPQDELYSLNQLFLFPSQMITLNKWMAHRAGLILFTGPTGSGKTTTMYALLEHYLRNQSCQAITLEDPIEKNMEDILQVQVNEKAGITYQAGLKAALRHDPDIIMVGEIRDAQTAKFAFEAALTGHLVLSTLHARDSAGTIDRLLEMGIGKSELGQSLIAVAAVELLPVIEASESRGRAAIVELLDDKQLESVIWELPQPEKTNPDFNHLRKKAFAYGFISKETYYEAKEK